MPENVPWLDPARDRAWRAYRHAQDQLLQRLHLHLIKDSGVSMAEYQVLAALSADPAGALPAQVLCSQMQWEKSRLSHQVRRMQKDGLIARKPNPADARSVIIELLPRGRRAITRAAPSHVRDVRRLFIDLLTPAELDTITAVSERVLRRLGEETLPEPAGDDDDAIASETRHAVG